MLTNGSLYCFIQHCCAGLAASLVSQTIMVPVDVVSQHQQVLGAEQRFSTVSLKKSRLYYKVNINLTTRSEQWVFRNLSTGFPHILKNSRKSGKHEQVRK